jgi:aspartyl-tRNA(Asn)/glutamyl-tRNA(Gln) amidotransferase subunit A
VAVDHDLLQRSAAELAALIRGRELSPVQLVEQSLLRIDALDSLNAFLTVDGEAALAQARTAERQLTGGHAIGPLHGLPVGVKDLQDTNGLRTTYGSLAYADHVPAADAIIVERMRAAGAIVVGKTNTPAFGLIGETKNRLRGPCRNPWNPDLTSGGSSGGSAVAVVTGMCALATGTDSGGSISAPAGMCGGVGLKPTRGRIPMWPDPGDSLLFNHEGVLTRTVDDAALALAALAGHDARDPLSPRGGRVDLAPGREQSPGRFAFAFWSDPLGPTPIDPELGRLARGGAELLAGVGGSEREVRLQVTTAWEAFTRVFLADVQAGLGAFIAEHGDELYPESHREFSPLATLTPGDVARGWNQLWRIRSDLDDVFERVDIVCTPATAVPAFPVGEPPDQIAGQPVKPVWSSFMPFGVIWNITGRPVIALPCGMTESGLPVGLILAGRVGEDERLLRIARALEQTLPPRPVPDLT